MKTLPLIAALLAPAPFAHAANVLEMDCAEKAGRYPSLHIYFQDRRFYINGKLASKSRFGSATDPYGNVITVNQGFAEGHRVVLVTSPGARNNWEGHVAYLDCRVIQDLF